jgi:hypothetical protein
MESTLGSRLSEYCVLYENDAYECYSIYTSRINYPTMAEALFTALLVCQLFILLGSISYGIYLFFKGLTSNFFDSFNMDTRDLNGSSEDESEEEESGDLNDHSKISDGENECDGEKECNNEKCDKGNDDNESDKEKECDEKETNDEVEELDEHNESEEEVDDPKDGDYQPSDTKN